MSINGVLGVPTNEERALINRMNVHANKVQLGDKMFSAKQCLVGKYDYSVQGASTAGVYLDDAKGEDLKLPANFIITNVIIDRVTAIANTAADTTTVFTMGVNSTADILASTPKTAFDGTGFLAGVPVGTAATAIRVTAESKVIMVPSAGLTAGKFYVSIEGYQGRSF